MKKRTQEEVQAIMEDLTEMYNKGMPVQDMCTELGISSPYAYQLMMRAGLKLRSEAFAISPEEEKKLVTAYLNGEVMSAVLVDLGISYNKMYSILLKNGVPVREIQERRREAREARKDRAVGMYKDGFSLADILAETGIYQVGLHQELRKRGVPRRRELVPLPDDSLNP